MIYLKAKELSNKFNVDFHVDHIIPLQGKLVCGLHVEYNLQLLDSTINHQKFNKLDPELGVWMGAEYYLNGWKWSIDL